MDETLTKDVPVFSVLIRPTGWLRRSWTEENVVKIDTSGTYVILYLSNGMNRFIRTDKVAEMTSKQTHTVTVKQ